MTAMTTPTATERQHRINTTRRMTPKQAQYVADLVDARYTPDDEEGRKPWRDRWDLVRNHGHVSALIEDLQEVPTLAQRERQAKAEAEKLARDSAADTEGMYRNPETGELYRLRYDAKAYGFIVSKYSQTGGPRRLVSNFDEIVSGKWKRWTAFNSRLALARGEIRKDWAIDAKELSTEYAYGFCPLHNGPLTDGVSVVLGYGPDCAKKYGLPWSEEAAQRVLDGRDSTSS